MDFLRSRILFMHLWPVAHFFHHFLTAFAVKQSKSDEINGQLARGAYIIYDLLRNPHFSYGSAARLLDPMNYSLLVKS